MTDLQFYSTFNTEEKCANHIKSFYDKNITNCPHCNHFRLKWNAKTFAWRCSKCGKRTSLKSISFMRDSNKSFTEWLQILHLVCHTKKARSIAEIHRRSEQTRYETVYHMVQKIRREMGRVNLLASFNVKSRLPGIRIKNAPKLKFLNLYIRLSAKSDKDEIYLHLPKTRSRQVLTRKRRILDLYPYPKLCARDIEFSIPFVKTSLPKDHKIEIWLNHVTQNLYRLLRGIFHYSSDFHVQGVLDEYVFKYNRRHEGDSVLDLLFLAGASAPIQYQ